eukprot:1183144-Prorocentrum_minimum.AAC.3
MIDGTSSFSQTGRIKGRTTRKPGGAAKSPMSPAGGKASSVGTPTKKGTGTPAKGKGTPSKGKGTPDPSQKSIADLFKRQLTPKRKTGDAEQGNTQKKQALSLEVDRQKLKEWKQNSVTLLDIDADTGISANNEKDQAENGTSVQARTYGKGSGGRPFNEGRVRVYASPI